MDLSSNLTTLDVTALVVGLVVAVVAAVVSAGVITRFVVSSRRDRIARHESVRTYYRRELALTH